MESSPIRVEEYQTSEGGVPFQEWMHSLKDLKSKAIALTRIARLEAGNFGDFKAFDSIIELRIDYGPGYRIYCAEKEKKLIILLVGGSKKSQKKDIQKAKDYWEDYQKRTSPRRPL